jgi:hypothetical protein
MPTTIDSAGITFNDTTSLTSANIGTAQLVNGSVTASKLGINEQKQICKAWVNFDGTTSPGTIRSSYNVSSVTKNGAGDYTVNFATPMADANYSVSHGLQGVSASTAFSCQKNGTNPTTTNVSIVTFTTPLAAADTPFVFVIIFGN